MSKRVLSQQQLQERIDALKQFKSHSWGTFTLDDGRNVIDTVHIDHQLQAYEKLLETAEPAREVVTVVKLTPNPKDYKTGYNSGYIAGARKADTEGTDLLSERPKANSRTSEAPSGLPAGEKGRL